MTTYTRREDAVLKTIDGVSQNPPYIPTFPRHVYLRHLNRTMERAGAGSFSPVVCINVTDSSVLAPSITRTGPTDGSTVILRGGQEVPVLSYVFANWPLVPKGHLAWAMKSGFVEVHEDYLGGTRKLTLSQMMGYVAYDAPWTTYILHRTKTGTTDDAVPPIDTRGVFATEFNVVKCILQFTGGTAPTATVTAWHREVEDPGSALYSWVRGQTFSLTADSQELTINNGYREIYIQLTSIAGTPTSTAIKLSGAAV